MKNNRIISSWNKIDPGDSASDRMLAVILEQNRSAHGLNEAENEKKASDSQRIIWVRRGVAAVFVLLLTGAVAFSLLLRSNTPSIDRFAVEGVDKTGAESTLKPDVGIKGQDTSGRNVVAEENNSHSEEDRPETEIGIPDEFRIVWADDANDVMIPVESALREWRGSVTVSLRLYDALESGGENDLFAVLAHPAIDYDFEYEGKTIAAYYSDMCDEKNLPELLKQLMKQGDALKYGTALYETGTPDGERWAQSFYEERVKYYGDAVLEKYIVNGEFLKDKLEQDIEKAENRREATAAYVGAMSAYLDHLAASVPGMLPAKGVLPSEALPERCGVLMYLTKDQFSSFTAGNVEGWFFDLAGRNNDETVPCAEYVCF